MAVVSKNAPPNTNLQIVDYWQIQNTPAVAAQATASQAAGAAGVRHVCKRIMVSVSAGATAQTPLAFNLRDGATGAGTILWSIALSAVVNTSTFYDADNLNLIGTAATAMTIESAAATAAAVQGTVQAQGYDVQ